MSLRPLRWGRRRLAVKIFLPALLAAFLVTAVGSMLLQHRLASDRRKSLLQHSQALVQTLFYGVENLTRPDELERFLLVAGAGRDVRGIWLLSGSPPRVLLSNHIQDRGMSPRELAAFHPGVDEGGSLEGGRRTAAGWLFRRPVQLSRELRLGVPDSGTELLVLVDTSELDAQQARISRHFLLSRAFVLAALLSSLSLVLLLLVLRPLSRLEHQVREVEAGAPPENITSTGEDELSRLALAVRRALSEVREERSRFLLVADHNPGLIYRCRNDGYWTMEYMSGAVKELTGHPAEDFIRNARLDYESVIVEADREHVRESVERGLAGDRSWDIEYRVRHRDGSARLVREQGRGHLDPETGDWVLDCIILDQSERLRKEELARRLAELEQVRQAGLRTMAGSVAHHFNNLLTGLMGMLDLARLELDLGRSPSGELQSCQEITQRAAALSRLMLLYVGEGERDLRPVVLAPCVRAQLAVRRGAGQPVPALAQEGTPGHDRLLGHEGLLAQLVDQLLENALEASVGREEQIHLSVGVRAFHEEELAGAQIPAHLDPAGNPFLEVSDAGEGMSPDVLERAFDPFFTTRFTGRGLGLAAVTGIVRLHRGGLLCRSRQGEGTRILVLFPRLPS